MGREGERVRGIGRWMDRNREGESDREREKDGEE